MAHLFHSVSPLVSSVPLFDVCGDEWVSGKHLWLEFKLFMARISARAAFDLSLVFILFIHLSESFFTAGIQK